MTFPSSFGDMMRRLQERRARDAQRYAELDDDLCQLCDAYGADKRSLRVDCGYVLEEAIPEAIDLFAVPDMSKEMRSFYYLRICKSCRGALLGVLRTWRTERVSLRGVPKDHDGNLDDGDPDRNIPVRIDGRIVMMNDDEYTVFRQRRGL